MSDTTTETEAPVVATEAPAEKPAKQKAAPKPCFCSRFLLVDESDGDNPAEFDTDCSATTMRSFAQGHDARLVSFLVQGEFDGLKVHENRDGVRYQYDGAAHAVGTISQALADKADAAISRLRVAADAKKAREAERTATRDAKAAEAKKAKETKDAEKAAAKAAKEAEKANKPAKATAPREVGATVVEGSQEGGNGGFTKIKVGRGEYDAVASEVDNGEGGTKTVYTYRNLQGVEETRDADLVRVLG